MLPLRYARRWRDVSAVLVIIVGIAVIVDTVRVIYDFKGGACQARGLLKVFGSNLTGERFVGSSYVPEAFFALQFGDWGKLCLERCG